MRGVVASHTARSTIEHIRGVLDTFDRKATMTALVPRSRPFLSRKAAETTRIYSFDLETGEETLLHQIQPVDPAGLQELGNPQISADGQAYAYTVHRTLSTLFLVEGLK